MATSASRALLLLTLSAVLACSSCAAFCQTTYQRVPRGTAVPLELTAPLSSRDAVVGQRVTLEVAEDVWVGMTLLLPKGADTVATVSEVGSPGAWGRSGRIKLQFGEIDSVDGTPLELGALTQERDEKKGYAAGATIGGAAILGPVGLIGGVFVRGKHVDYPAGHRVWSAVAWETAVRASELPAQPVAAPAQPVVAPAQPVVAPAQPVAAPAQPVAAPAQPVVAPAQPAVAPAQPAKPEQPATPPQIAPVIPVIEDVPAPAVNKK